MEFLGYVVSLIGIFMDPSKILPNSRIKNTASNVQRSMFLGIQEFLLQIYQELFEYHDASRKAFREEQVGHM